MEIRKVSYMYTAEGYIIGKAWGSGLGSYPAKFLVNHDRQALIEEAQEMLESGALDSGFGFEYLVLANLTITKATTLDVDGKEFVNYERDEVDELIVNPLYEKEVVAVLEALEEDLYV